MAAVGWHGKNMNGLDMDRYLNTIVPLINKKLNSNSFIRHLSDNYANAPQGFFGTFKINDIVDKNLINFVPPSNIMNFFKRFKYIIYHTLRINIKRYFKKNKLHKDLRSGLIFR